MVVSGKCIERYFDAASESLVVLGRLSHSIGYYFDDDLKPRSKESILRLAKDLRRLRLAGAAMWDLMREEKHLRDTLARAAVKMRLPSARACGLNSSTQNSERV